MTYATEVQQAPTSYKHSPYQSLSDIKAVEISFEEHKIYIGTRAVAKIVRDDEDFITQPWVVMVNDVEIHRANTWAKCYDYILWHLKQETLPEQKEEVTPVDCQRRALPIFVSKQKSRPVTFVSNLALRISTICFELFSLAIKYILLLFKRRPKSCRNN